MKKIVKWVKNPRKVVNAILLKFPILGRLIPDKAFLKIRYGAIFGKKLDLDSPKTYNEKLQWLKLYNRNPLYTLLVDKYAVKKWVADKIGDQYIIPTLGVWEKFDDIDFAGLPDQFVLKCTHDSGGLVIVKDKKVLNLLEAKEKITRCLKKNFYYFAREWPYKNVPARIIAERYMEDETGELKDYKFFCFDGKVKSLFIASDRQNQNEDTKFDFFDRDYNHLPFTNGHPNARDLPQRPRMFDEMISLAEKLSCGFPHVRVDFYEIGSKIYFGEMTFFHWSGFVPFYPEEWDYKFGSWINLPSKM